MNVFLSCTKTKKTIECKAKEMYSPSDIFSKSYEYAKTILKPDHIYILSAKHHLLSLDEKIKPYNKTLIGASVDVKKKWAEEVYKQMKEANIDFNAKTYFLCGNDYVEYLKEYFPNHECLFDGKGIGEIMHWLDKEMGKLNESFISYLKYRIIDNIENYLE